MEHPPDYSLPGTPESASLAPEDEGSAPGSVTEAADLPAANRPATGQWPSVSVVVLNYNGLKHLEPCFTSLLALDYPGDRLELMVVDNGSSDSSLPFMRERFPSVRLVETGENLGFAAGNDYGAQRANGQYVAFLNNDTRVEPDWLKELVAALANGAEDGTVCSSSLMLDWEGKHIDFQAGALNFHGFGFQPSYGLPLGEANLDPRALLFACGGSMLIQRDVFLAIGGFDPDYFAFFEDVDLGWRLWLLGYRVVLAPKAVTYHRHHGTAGSMPGHRVLVLYERNALYTIYKNYSDANLERILPAALLLLGQRAVRYAELGGVDFSSYDFTDEKKKADSEENVHRLAVASLLAVDHFRENLHLYGRKREWIQAQRKRTDEEMFALFGQPGRVHLLNHETDAPYAAAHFSVLREFSIEDSWSEQPKEVLVISPDVLPVGDIPASGSGIRAWALGKGLESRGHHVRFTMPRAAINGRENSVPPEYLQNAWTPDSLQSLVDALHPDVVVSCGWPNLTWLSRANLPVALDLAGPHLLERAYQGYRDVAANAEEKLAALRRADFYTCISERQRYYFAGWLAQAGVEVSDLTQALAVIPYSLSPEQPLHIWPENLSGDAMRFVYGGIFLPWQNPAPALLAVANELEAEGRGVLEIIGGRHPFHAVDTGAFGPLMSKLSTMPRVSMSGLLPHDRLVERYTQAHVAVDVMQPNMERELAFPSRTVHYMWCGLPVIHAAFSEVAAYIEQWEAGWVVPHDSEEALKEVVRGILANPQEARRRGENAQRLARELFSWDKTVDALDRFVRRPDIRKGRGWDNQATVVKSGLSRGPDKPSAYVLASPKDQLPPKARKLAEQRRTMPAQLGAKSSALLKALLPVTLPRRGSTGSGGAVLPDLIAGHSHGQRFLSAHNGLAGLIIPVNTFGRRNTCRLTLHLRSNPAATEDIYMLEVSTHMLRDNSVINFRFPPIEDSANRWFYFVAESPDGVPGDAISFFISNAGTGNTMQRYEDGLPAHGQLSMSLEYGDLER